MIGRLFTIMKIVGIDQGKEFNWGNTSKDYAKYRDIYPDAFYEKITYLGLCTNGQTALDLGTGTGVLPRNMFKFGADWTGVDISDDQIAEAIRLASEKDMKIRFFAAPAEETRLPDEAFDVITACQCFMYFDKNKVIPEIERMLKPNGRFLILFMAWLPYECEIAMRSENLVLKYNPEWTGCHYKRHEPIVPDWSKDYFDCINCIAYDTDVHFTRESWHGRMIACRGIGASSLPQAEIERFKNEHWAYMLTLPARFVIPHHVTILDFQKRTRK